MQGFFNISKSVNAIHHINNLKKKSHILISIDAEKAFVKIQHPFMIKILLKKVGIERTYIIIRKAIYDKPITNIFNVEYVRIRSGIRQGYPHSLLLLNIVLEVLAMEIREKKKRNKRTPNWKRRH